MSQWVSCGDLKLCLQECIASIGKNLGEDKALLEVPEGTGDPPAAQLPSEPEEGGYYTLQLNKSPLQQPRVINTCTPITIPPNSEMIVPARVQTEWSRWAVLQPDETETLFTHRGTLVGRTLVNLMRGVIPMWTMNLSQQPQDIQKGTPLATREQVLSIVQTAVESVQTDGLQDLGQIWSSTLTMHSH